MCRALWGREGAGQSIPFIIMSYICDMQINQFFHFTIKLYYTSNLSSSGSLVESLHIPLLTNIQGCVHKHLEERQPSSLMDLPGIKTILMLKKTRRCGQNSGTCTRFDQQGKYIQPRYCLCRLSIVSSGSTHPAIGRNEAGDAHQPGVSKQPRHLSNAPDVLFTVLWAEAKVFVQPLTDVVAIQSVAGNAMTDQVLL